MTGSAALERLRAVYADRLGEARRRHAAGSRLVGYFLNSVPVELILAAGLDPIRLAGQPEWRSPLADTYLEEYFDGEVQALFCAAVEGRFDMLDLLVVPRTSEVYLQLYYFLLEVPKWEADARVPPLHLLDLLQTPLWTTARYDLGRFRAFAERLGGVSDDALRDAIVRINRLRSLLTEASKLWMNAEPRLTGVDALAVIGAASILQPDEAIAALETLIADPPASLGSSGPRLLLKGSPQSDPRLTAAIEAAGARVVAHDHIAGDTTYARLVRSDGDPWEALVHHYQCDIPGPRAYPQSRQDERFVALAEAAQVDGVIIVHDEHDDTLGWEYPDQKRLLDARGIPSLFLKRQSYADPHVAIAAFLDEVSA